MHPPARISMLRQLVLLCASALAISACQTAAPVFPADTGAPAPTERQLVGTWRMAAVFQDGVDVSDTQNPARNRRIVLRSDRSFLADGDPYGRNTGVWTYDAAAGTLELVSDLGTADDSVWRVSIQGREMVWRGIGSRQAERVVIVARRTE